MYGDATWCTWSGRLFEGSKPNLKFYSYFASYSPPGYSCQVPSASFQLQFFMNVRNACEDIDTRSYKLNNRPRFASRWNLDLVFIISPPPRTSSTWCTAKIWCSRRWCAADCYYYLFILMLRAMRCVFFAIKNAKHAFVYYYCKFHHWKLSCNQTRSAI